MKKSIKNKAIAILACLFAIALSCTLIGTSTVRADEVSKEQNFINNVNEFVTLADADGNGSLTAEEVREVMGTKADTYFLAMYNFVSNDDTAAEHEEGYDEARNTVYPLVLAQYDYNGAVQLYSTLVTGIRDIYTKTGFSYDNHGTVETARADLNRLSGSVDYAKDYAFLKNCDLPKVEVEGVEEFQDIYEAEKKIKEWREAIVNAINAIKAIKVYVSDVAANDTVAVFDDAANAYRSSYEVLLSSKTTIGNARTLADKVKSVNGTSDLKYIDGTVAFEGDKTNHYAILTGAEESLKDQYTKITDVETLIDKASAEYSDVAGAEKCYTIWASRIKPAQDAYDGLTGTDYNGDGIDDNLNNLKNGVKSEKVSKLNEMVVKYSLVKAEIAGVVSKINAIGTVSYNNASKTLKGEAKKAFNSLPNDVKVNDETEGQENLCVENYATLVKAEKDWAKFEAEVNALIDSIKGLREIEVTNGADIFNAFGNTQLLYNNLSDQKNQLKGDAANGILGVEPTLLDEAFTPINYTSEVTTCKGAYEYYQTLSQAINTATKEIKKNINELKLLDVRFTDTFDKKVSDIVKAIGELPKIEGELDPRYRGAIDNYNDFITIQGKYNELLALAGTWADSVVATVSVNTFEAVATSVVNFEAIVAKYLDGTDEAKTTLKTDLAAFNKIYVDADTENTDKAFKDYYATFAASEEKKTEIIAKLDAVKEAANVLVRPELTAASENAAYATAVADVTALYNALATYDDTSVEGYITTAEYFETNENYSDAYVAYRNSLIYVAANAIEEEIAKITNTGLEVADYISAARTAYNRDVAEGSVFTKEEVQGEVRNYGILTTAEANVTAFINGVYDLLKGASYEGADVAASDVTIPSIMKDESLIAGFYKVNVTTTTALAEAYNELTDVEKAYVSGELSVAAANDLLRTIIDLASFNAETEMVGKKLSYLDTQLATFISQYVAGTVEAGRYETLDAYVNALTGTQQQYLTNLGDFQQIQRDKELADRLKDAIDNLYDEVVAGKVTNETVIDYYVISSIYEGLNNSQKKLIVSAYNEGDASKTLADIKAKIDESTVIDIAGALEDLKTKIDDLKEDTGADIAGINNQITDISGNIEAINSQLNALNTLLKVANDKNTIDEINEKITALEAAKTELQGKIETLNTDLNNAKNDLQSKINAANTALETAKTELNGKIDSSKTELQGKIDALKTELEGKLDAAKAELQGKITALETAKTELEGKIAATNTELSNTKTALENKDKELEDMIKKVEKDLTEKYDGEVKSLKDTITVISVIFGILIAACAACVVVLFVKKK